VFESLSEKLNTVFSKLRGRGLLTEAEVDSAMREIRIALLEADVALPVIKTFIEKVKSQAIGQEVLRSITPTQMVVKIVHDCLIEILGGSADDKNQLIQQEPLNFAQRPPISYMMVGLQGSGKTTSTGKLAKYITEKYSKKVLLVSLDVYRPAAQQQLETLAKQIDVPSLEIVEGEMPLQIAKRALDQAKLKGIDIVLFDTAGRLHIDDQLMTELVNLSDLIQPLETILVADAMTGQDSVNIANHFKERLNLTGLILTRVDGDTRGGAALSMRSLTGCPIKFLGVGERVGELEVFQPSRIADRILDMGDVVGLVEKVSQSFDQAEAEKMAQKMQKGQFDLDDMVKHLEQMMKMGGITGIMGLLPGMGKLKEKVQELGVGDKTIKRQIAIVQSMTKKERKNPSILNAARRRRIATGCGQTVADVNRLLKQFQQMQAMMKQMGKSGGKGFMRSLMGGGMNGMFGRK